MVSSRWPIELQDTHVLLAQGTVTLLVRRDWVQALPVDAMLAGAPLQAWGELREHELVGRAPVHVLGTARGEIVAKSARRGGALGGLLRSLYVGRWRGVEEAAVAELLARAGCPAPPVVAARATRRGVLYRLDLATARVAGAADLADVLLGGGDAVDVPALAAAAGRTLRRLHDAGLRHRDLQVKNLLVPPGLGEAGLLTIIDLDRCTFGSPLDDGERVRSVARFSRSLIKRRLLTAGRSGAVRAFLAGYGPLSGRSRSWLLAGVAARLRATLWLHPWWWERRLG